jgi:hypothetical protein
MNMTSLMVRDREEAKKKGYLAVGATVGSGLLFWAGAPFLGAGAAAGAAYLTFKWFMFRARRGMRF